MLVETMFVTLERFLSQLHHAEGQGTVCVRVDRGNNGVTKERVLLWQRGTPVVLGRGLAPDLRETIFTLPITEVEFISLYPLFTVPAYHGYSYTKSNYIELRELNSEYRRLALDSILADHETN